MKDFRLMACCNVPYKCYSNVLTEMLKAVLPTLIRANHSAIIKGRSITENILLVHELMRRHHKNAGKPRWALKIDLMKAYDSVKWDFVLRVMEFMGFPDLFRSWVSKCFTTAQFSLNLNCSLVGFFKSEKRA